MKSLKRIFILICFVTSVAMQTGFAQNITGNVTDENGVKAAMQMLSKLYPNAAEISDTQVADYLAARPFDMDNAMKMIHEQYWVVTFLNEYEAFANWRRTGFPELQPFGGEAVYDGNVTQGTIPRRMIYPNGESSTNPESFAAALARQGQNEFTTRVWWDQ